MRKPVDFVMPMPIGLGADALAVQADGGVHLVKVVGGKVLHKRVGEFLHVSGTLTPFSSPALSAKPPQSL